MKMKQIRDWVLVIFVYLPLLIAPFLAPIFGMVWLISAIVTFFPNGASAYMAPYFFVCLWVWGVCALFSLFVYFTFEYREPGSWFFGGVSPLQYALDLGWHSAEILLSALLWPYTLYFFDQNMRGWGYTFADITLQCFQFWHVERKHGFEVTSIDLRTGASETTRAGDPSELADLIKDAMSGSQDKQGE